MSKELFAPYNNKTPEFSLFGTSTYARVTSVHDGDTLTCIIPIFNQFFKFTTRLNGIDTCEITSDNAANKQLAVKARNRLIDIITHGDSKNMLLDGRKFVCDLFDKDIYLIWLECGSFDKYGRLLVTAKLHQEDPKSFSQILIDEHLAYKYDGGKKLSEEEQINLLCVAS